MNSNGHVTIADRDIVNKYLDYIERHVDVEKSMGTDVGYQDILRLVSARAQSLERRIVRGSSGVDIRLTSNTALLNGLDLWDYLRIKIDQKQVVWISVASDNMNGRLVVRTSQSNITHPLAVQASTHQDQGSPVILDSNQASYSTNGLLLDSVPLAVIYLSGNPGRCPVVVNKEGDGKFGIRLGESTSMSNGKVVKPFISTDKTIGEFERRSGVMREINRFYYWYMKRAIDLSMDGHGKGDKPGAREVWETIVSVMSLEMMLMPNPLHFHLSEHGWFGGIYQPRVSDIPSYITADDMIGLLLEWGESGNVGDSVHISQYGANWRVKLIGGEA